VQTEPSDNDPSDLPEDCKRYGEVFFFFELQTNQGPVYGALIRTYDRVGFTSQTAYTVPRLVQGIIRVINLESINTITCLYWRDTFRDFVPAPTSVKLEDNSYLWEDRFKSIQNEENGVTDDDSGRDSDRDNM
jgi:hypothetical protein